ncbi:O-methyltransferase [Streptomyces sp. NPDC002574]|uniref:O-methyltransferase n=1 Tax=Streptomyces sp. NPDC002574 TaxID=3364652 RepID=UPI0036862A89
MAGIDYQLRPSKAVQRHMIVDVCRRLTAMASLEEYQYVGFGALEFVDFHLMHRALNINVMTSIEADTGSMDRYQFNRPFKTIEIVPGRASEVLGEIGWDKLSIVWLDYTRRLNEEAIHDVSLLCGRLQPGSALFVTLNAHPERKMDGRRQQLVDLIGEERIPPQVTDESLALWGLAVAQKTVLNDVIVKALRDRQVSAEWKQVIDIHYADNAKMQTIGGIVVGLSNRVSFDSCRFQELDFVRFAGDEPLEVRVPILTAKERRALEEQLPLPAGDELKAPWLKEQDARDFLRLYRYMRPEHVNG